MANKAKANAKANDAVEAIVTERIEANVINEIVAANEAITIDKVIAVNATITKLKSDATTNRNIAKGRDLAEGCD